MWQIIFATDAKNGKFQKSITKFDFVKKKKTTYFPHLQGVISNYPYFSLPLLSPQVAAPEMVKCRNQVNICVFILQFVRHSPIHLRRRYFTRGGMRSTYRSARIYGGRIGHDSHLSRRYPLHSVDISPLRNTSKQEHKEASTSHTHRHSHSRSARSSEKRERKPDEQNVGDGFEKDSKINRDRDKSKNKQADKKVKEAKTVNAVAKASIESEHGMF